MSNLKKTTLIAYGLTAFTLGLLWSMGYLNLALAIFIGFAVVLGTEWLMRQADR